MTGKSDFVLRLEPLLTISGAHKNPPVSRAAHEIVSSAEPPGLLPARSFDSPLHVRDGEVIALLNECARLKAGGGVSVLAIQPAQGDHVLADRFERTPVRIAGIVSDTRWHRVQLRDGLAIELVERSAILLEEGADLGCHDGELTFHNDVLEKKPLTGAFVPTAR